MRIVIGGSSGLIGTELVDSLRKDGHEVLRLVRRKPTASSEIFWNPAAGELDFAELSGCNVIINLAGAGVGDSRWTDKYKAMILSSRVDSTSLLAKAAAEVKPEVFIAGSAIGWYGETGDRGVTESDRGGDDFLAGVCEQWEAAADLAPSVRTVKIRTGVVLDPTGGALGKMLPLFKFGVGGKMGSGKQWWSWITLHDQIRSIQFLMDSDLAGPVNITAPNPATNSEFTAALARALHRPALLPVPGIALKVALGGFSSELLGSKKVLPEVLTNAGFVFDYPHVAPALTALTASD